MYTNFESTVGMAQIFLLVYNASSYAQGGQYILNDCRGFLEGNIGGGVLQEISSTCAEGHQSNLHHDDNMGRTHVCSNCEQLKPEWLQG